MKSLVALGRCFFYLCLLVTGGFILTDLWWDNAWRLFLMSSRTDRFRKRDLSEHPSMLGEGAGSGLACGSEHPQPGILGALGKGIKVTGLWLLPSPPLLLSFLFLLLPLLSFPSSCCSLPVSHAMGSVLLVIRGANVVQQPTCKHQDRVAEPLSLPNPAHCEQPTSLSHPGPLLLLLSQKRDRRLPRMMHNEEQRLF